VSLVMDLHRDDNEDPVAPEIITPSLTSQNLDDKMKWPRRSNDSQYVETEALRHLRDWRWADLDSHGYVVIDVTPARVTAEFWHLDTVLERTPNEELAAVWTVAHGAKRAERQS
jgi:hypothetical protein